MFDYQPVLSVICEFVCKNEFTNTLRMSRPIRNLLTGLRTRAFIRVHYETGNNEFTTCLIRISLTCSIMKHFFTCIQFLPTSLITCFGKFSLMQGQKCQMLMDQIMKQKFILINFTSIRENYEIHRLSFLLFPLQIFAIGILLTNMFTMFTCQ